MKPKDGIENVDIGQAIITRSLVRAIRQHYELPWHGIHGIGHWARVLENGLRLAPLTGADEQVVALFAVFHDSQRINESIDPEHGRRGAELAAHLRGREFKLSDDQFDLLQTACILHADGLTEADVTVQTCWDADRLDLWRVGMWPDPRKLCTAAAKDRNIIAWSQGRSVGGQVPEFVRKQWKAG